MEIAELMLRQQMYRFDEASRAAFGEYLRLRAAQPHFANARSVRNAIDRIRLRQAVRLVEQGGRIPGRRTGPHRRRRRPPEQGFPGRPQSSAGRRKPRKREGVVYDRKKTGNAGHHRRQRRGQIHPDAGIDQTAWPGTRHQICTDDYHKYDRRERARAGITALHPDCNYLDILELQLERLHYGQPILKPVYDHSTGMLVGPNNLRPREFVIVEGLLGFHTAVMRQFYDVKVFLQPPEELRRVWKIKRDTTKRGYTADRYWRSWKSARRTRATSFARSGNMPTSWCSSIRRPASRRSKATGI